MCLRICVLEFVHKNVSVSFAVFLLYKRIFFQYVNRERHNIIVVDIIPASCDTLKVDECSHHEIVFL